MATGKLLLLITGANTGLGYYAVQELSSSNKYHILLGSRSLAKAEDAITSLGNDVSGNANTSNIEPIQIDVNSDSSIIASAKFIEEKYGYLDILMNNAGISKAIGVLSDIEPNADGSGPSLREQYRQQYDTNVFGSAVVTEVFLPLLRNSTKPGGKRIAFTGSGTASLQLTINPSTPSMKARNFRIYRSTKTALNMVMISYAEELEADGFVVSASNPGYCATNLNAHKGFKDPRDGAKVLIRAIEGKKEDVHSMLIDEETQVPW